MKSIYNHYKFRALLMAARLGLTYPLHYSIVNNLGFAIVIASVIIVIDGGEDQVSFAAFGGIIGFLMAGDMAGDMINHSND